MTNVVFPPRGLLTLFLAALLGPGVRAQEAAPGPKPVKPSPPGQPETGFGGREYAHALVVSSRHGDGGLQHSIFTPAEPVPARAPVVVFLHGWAGMEARLYQAWIDHLVRRGSIVIFPRYQAGVLTPPPEMTPNAVRAVTDALARLEKDGPVRPDRGRFALIGHSLGGVIGANLAARSGADGLPVARALMAVEPGDSRNAFAIGPGLRSIIEAPEKMPAEMLMLAVAGEDDYIVGSGTARRLVRRATAVPAERKALVRLRSDAHGEPALHADHFAPLGGRRGAGVDALDWRGLWRVGDALLAGAFAPDAERRFPPVDDPAFRALGEWSDGTPVKPLERMNED